MGPVSRMVPAPGSNRFQIRGEVIEIVSKITGWLFPKIDYGIKIKLDEERMKQLRKENGDTPNTFPEGQVCLFMSKEKLTQFPIGTIVELTFAQAGQIEQLFAGRIPLSIVGISPIECKEDSGCLSAESA